MNQKKKIVIGITGYARSGKDTAGNFLEEEMGFEKASFAEKLKEIVCEMFDMTPEQVEDGKLKAEVDPRYGVTRRKILQHIGTEGFRALYPTVWGDYLFRKIQKSDKDLFVITDVRFEDEAALIRKHGGIVVKVVRDDHQELNGEEKAHKSEEYPGSPDHLFEYAIHANTGEIEEIRKRILDIAKVEIYVAEQRLQLNKRIQDES